MGNSSVQGLRAAPGAQSHLGNVGEPGGAMQKLERVAALLRLGAEQAWRRGLSRVTTRLYWRQEHTQCQVHAAQTGARCTPCRVHRKLCWPSGSLPGPGAPHFLSHTQPALCGRPGAGQSRVLTPHPPRILPGSHLSPLVIESCQLFGPLGVWGQPSPCKQAKKRRP